jgi:hypothetical protein
MRVGSSVVSDTSARNVFVAFKTAFRENQKRETTERTRIMNIKKGAFDNTVSFIQRHIIVEEQVCI